VVAAASVEASLDFPDEELPATILDGLADAIRAVRSDMADLLATWTEGHLLRDGATLVIAGRPNVGKSTLLNALLGKDRAIVSPHPGTTRDFIEEGMVIGGYPVRIVDTAGLRASDCDIEREGIRRTSDQIARADLILHVMDASQDVCDKHESLINESRETPVLVVYNKVDIAAEDYRKRAGADVGGLAVSALRGDGIHELRQWIVRKLDGHGPRAMQHAAISERHRKLLAEASARVDEALDLLSSEEHRDADLAATALREALGSLGLVTGREYHKELLDNIFGRFCIGK
jgi:tRNA modification GTPase